jgi:hypothetical protein
MHAKESSTMRYSSSSAYIYNASRKSYMVASKPGLRDSDSQRELSHSYLGL